MSDPIRIFTRKSGSVPEGYEEFQSRVNQSIADEGLLVMNMQALGGEKGYVRTIVVHVEESNQWTERRDQS